jgi:C1A family cysteine protease
MKHFFALALLGMAASASQDEWLDQMRSLKKKDKKDKKEEVDELDSEDERDSIEVDTLIDESGEFQKYIAKNNKFYLTAEEYAHREDCWKKNHAKVKELNSKNKSVKFDDNFTSDLMQEEFEQMLGLNTSDLSEDTADKKKVKKDKKRKLESDHRQLSTAVNWVTAGKMGPVKNQGRCGSCWSFSATTALEAMQAIKDDAAPVRLSEQEGVDCTTNTQSNYDMFGKVYGTYGCQGGWMARYWNFARDNGAMLEADYPYVTFDYQYGDSAKLCKHDDSNIATRAGNSAQITGTIGDAVTKLQSGPLTFAVAAGNDCWRYYKSGVLTGADGCPTSLDHAVVAVGLDSETITTTTGGTSTTTCRKASKKERKRRSCTDGSDYRWRKCCSTTTEDEVTE